MSLNEGDENDEEKELVSSQTLDLKSYETMLVKVRSDYISEVDRVTLAEEK
jgi:hypothetical protein